MEVVVAGPHHGARLFVEHQLHPGAAGHRGQGQVIVRGPEPAGGEQHRHPALDGRAHGRGDLGLDIGQQGHPPHPPAAGRNQPAQPLRVRIEDLPTQQFVADGEDFDSGGWGHDFFPCSARLTVKEPAGRGAARLLRTQLFPVRFTDLLAAYFFRFKNFFSKMSSMFCRESKTDNTKTVFSETLYMTLQGATTSSR